MKRHFKNLLFAGIIMLLIGKGIVVNAAEVVTFEDSAFCSKVLSKVTEHASASDCSGAKTITFESSEDIESITAIRLYDTDFTSIEGIEHFTGLRQLDITNAGITDITPIKDLPALNLLDLSGNQIHDITPIAGITSLTGIDLDDNYIGDISALKNLNHLDYLDLSDNLIYDINALSNLKENLVQLFLNRNNITDISVLKDLTLLDYLDLSENFITDIKSLKDLTELIDLDLSHNLITDVTPLLGLTKLGRLDISNNAITDPSSLEELDEIFEISSFFSASSQWFDTYLEKGDTFQLPKIFLLAKDGDSKFYSENGVSCDYGCTIDENGLVTITDDAVIDGYALATIKSGYASYTSYKFNIVENKEDYFENELKTVSLKSLKDSLDGRFTLIATDIIGELEAEDKEDLNDMLTSGQLLAMFEIHMENAAGQLIELNNGSYEIRIKMTDEMKKYENFKMGYFDIDSESIIEVIEAHVDGEYIVFTTSHLSFYAMEGNLKNPATGDMIYVIIGLSVIALSGIYLTTKKIKKNN